MMKTIIKGFFLFCMTIATIIWSAWIIAAILRGYEFHEVYNSIMMGTLCLLLWLMIRHNEKLIEEKDAWRRRYYDLLDNVFDHVRKGKDLSDMAEPEKKSHFKDMED